MVLESRRKTQCINIFFSDSRGRSQQLCSSLFIMQSVALFIFLLPNFCVNFMLAILDADIAFLLNLSVSSFTLRKSFIPSYQINWWLLMRQPVFSLYFTDKIETVRKELLWCKDRKDILLSWFDTKALCTVFLKIKQFISETDFLFHKYIFQRQSVGIALFHEG